MAGPWIMPAMMAATEVAGGMAAPAAAAGLGAAGLGAGAGAAGAAGAGGLGSGLMSGLYGMLPGMVPGSQQAAMLASQTGSFGLPGLAATGNAAASGVSGPLGQSIWSGLSKLTGPGGNNLMTGLRGANTAMRGMQMMQGGGQGQPPPRSAPRVPPVQMGSPPQMAQRMPTPAELAAYRRVKWRAGDQGGRTLA
jgi:hypothetical protein